MAPASAPSSNPEQGRRARSTLPVVDDEGIFLGAIHDETLHRLVGEMAHAARAHAMLGTMLSVGEAYWVGVAGLLEGIVAAIGHAAPPPQSTTRSPS